ncbi:MAG TPA: hypothetical protein VMZ92_05670 [Planctomycetota bacterium]|nr:hypothetical protein [Planctomycetota bacterium]
MRRVLTVLVTVCAVTLSGSPVRAVGDPPRWVGLKTPCVAFAFNPRTGAVLGLDVNANTASLYPRAYLDSKNREIVGPVKTGTTPIAAVFKAWKNRAYFVVANYREARIDVLDAATLNSAAQVAVEGADVTSLTTSRRADDPYVYYAYGRGHDSAVRRVSVEDFHDEAVTFSSPHNSVMDMAVSADGTLMYTRGPWSPSGFQAFRAVPDEGGKVRWAQIFYDHTSVAAYLPDPFGIYTATGSVIYSADLKRKVSEVDGRVTAFFPDRPVIVTVGGQDVLRAGRSRRAPPGVSQTTAPAVTAVSYNDFRVLGSATLPAEKPNNAELAFPEGKEWGHGDFKRIGYRVQCFADAPADRVLVCSGGNVGIVPVSSLGVVDEPLLVAEIDAPSLLRVGQPGEITVKPVDRRARVSIKDPPAGMSLAGDRITWTPSSSQVGHTSVVLQLEHGAARREQTVDVDVVQPCVRLGFFPQGIAISPDGKRAVVWNVPGQEDPWDRGKGTSRSKLALVDVQTQKVLIEKELLYGITTAAVDAQCVYVAPADSERVNALDHKGLIRQKHVLTEGRALEVSILSPKLLAVRTEKGMSTFALPDLTVKKTGATALPTGDDETDYRWRARRAGWNDRDEMDRGSAVRLSDGWNINGTLFTRDMSRTRMLMTASGLPTLEVQRQNRASQRLPWHRLIRQGALMSVSGRQIVELGRGEACLLSEIPAAVVLSVSGWQGEKVSGRLTVRDLVSGEPVWQVMLFEEPQQGMDPERQRALMQLGGERRTMGMGHATGSSLVAAGRTILAVLGNRLFVVSLDDATVVKCTPPLEFRPLDEVSVLDGTKVNTVVLAVRGGQAPFEFELAASHDALGVDPKTGVVTVNGPKVLLAATQLLTARLFQEKRGYPDAADSMTPRQRITSLAKQAKDRYKRLTGLDATGIPVLLPVGVAVSDRNQQMASMDCQFVVEVPEATVIKVQAAVEAKARAEAEAREQETERQRKEYEARRAEEVAKRSAAEAGTDASLKERIRALEGRVRALEAQIDMLIRLLGDRAKPSKETRQEPKEPQ